MIYNISYKTLADQKPSSIRYDKIDGFIRIYGGTLFGSEKCNDIYDRIRYLTSLKSGTLYIFSHYFAKIKVVSYGSLPTEKILTFHNVMIKITTTIRYF